MWQSESLFLGKGSTVSKSVLLADLLAEIVHYIREIRLVPTLNQDKFFQLYQNE